MTVTKKKIRAMGPALSIGDIAEPQKQPARKTECKKSHKWNTGKFSRICFRCGKIQSIDTATKKWRTK